jgi:RHS repeat-associated protein
LFTGRYYDAETSLYYYRARVYNPYIGRFMQTDPSGYKGGINLYAYCGNNPIMLVDPYGLCGGYDYSSATKGLGSGFVRDFKNYWGGIATAPVDYYNVSRAAGVGTLGSVAFSANMSVGKIFGYSTLAEGLEGVDTRSVTETGGWTRAGQIGFGLVGTATTAFAGAGSLNAATSSVGPTSVSHWGSQGLKSGDWVMKGEASPSTYLRSGKWDINPTNEFAWPSSGQSFTVPGESLSYPSGLESWKGLLGQRIYNP